MERVTKCRLGQGLKTWVFTHPEIWTIDKLIWDNEYDKWYVYAHSDNGSAVDFWLTTKYIQKITGKKEIIPINNL